MLIGQHRCKEKGHQAKETIPGYMWEAACLRRDPGLRAGVHGQEKAPVVRTEPSVCFGGVEAG